MAAIWAYISAVWAGTEDPVWPHLVLVPGSALAGIAVGAGILFERPKYSAKVHSVAFWLVIAGVAIETLFTITLFIVDERISGAQQEKIIALELRLTPRTLSLDQQHEIADKLKPFPKLQFAFIVSPSPEPIRFMKDLAETLESAGWTWSVLPLVAGVTGGEFSYPIPGKPMAGTTTLFSGMQIEIPASHPEWGPAANALRDALNAQPAIAATTLPSSARVVDGAAFSVVIWIGAKP